MVKNKLSAKEKYMFESIYDSLAREKLRDFENDTEILANGYMERQNMASINIRRVEKKFKDYLKEKIRDVSQTLLIADINEKRQGVFEFWDIYPDSQYQQYIDRFFEKEYYEKFISRYKLWHEKIHRIMDLGYAYLLEIVKNYLRDIDKLIAMGLLKEANEYILNELEFLGDRRNGAKCTVRCKVNNDYIMYKPESGRIYELYGKLIRLVSGDNDYKILAMVQGNRYFWCEYASNDGCYRERDIKEYYKNAGFMLATAYLMNAVDIQYDNICAVGKYPVIVDAKTVSSMDFFSKPTIKEGKKEEKTVLSTSIIPRNLGKRREKFRVHSALGDLISNEDTKIEIISEFTSEAKQRRVKKRSEELSKHLPKLGKESVPVWNYVGDVMAGFEEGYDNITKNAFKIYNLLRNYENTKIRIMIRSTKVYSKLLKMLNMPDLLENKEAAGGFLEYVLRNGSMDEFSLKHEIRQLLRGDIPYFTTLLKDRTVYTEDWDRALIRRYTSCIECILSKLDQFSEEDKKDQLYLIKSAFDWSVRYS